MRSVKVSSILAVCLATGLSLGLLYGCNSSENSNHKTASSSMSSPQTSDLKLGITEDEKRTLLDQLNRVETKTSNLKNFINNIELETNQKIDYQEAQQKVNDLANEYTGFTQNDSFKKIKSQIESNPDLELLIKTSLSEERKILDNLASGQNRQAQENLKKLGLYSSAVDTTDPGTDGPNQQRATLNLLKNKILPAFKNTDELRDKLSSIPTSISPEELKQSNSSKHDYNFSWILTLLNSIALLAVPVSLFFWHKTSKKALVYAVHAKKNPSSESDIEKLKNIIFPIKDQLKEINNKLSKLEAKKIQIQNTTLQKISTDTNAINDNLDKIYHDVILQHLELLDPSNDLIQNHIDDIFQLVDKKLTEYSFQITSIAQENPSQKSLETLTNKIDKIHGLVQIISHKDIIAEEQHHRRKNNDEDNGILQKIFNAVSKNTAESSDEKIQQAYQDLLTQKEILEQEKKALEAEREQSINQIEELMNKEEIIRELKNEKDDLQNRYNDIDCQYENIIQEKEILLNENNNFKRNSKELENLLSEARSTIQNLEDDKKRIEQEKEQIKQEKERFKQLATKQAPETQNINYQWLSLVNAYQQNPEHIFNFANKQAEVTEDEGTFMERRNNASTPVILKPDDSPEGYYVVSLEADYLLFPKAHAIPESQKFTASALFEGYKSGNTNRFTLNLPAQVTPTGDGMWQLKQKGRLDYS